MDKCDNIISAFQYNKVWEINQVWEYNEVWKKERKKKVRFPKKNLILIKSGKQAHVFKTQMI